MTINIILLLIYLKTKTKMRWLTDSLSLFLQFGFTPLHLAAQNGDNSLVRVITNHPGVRVDSVTVKTVSNPGESASGALLSLVNKALLW